MRKPSLIPGLPLAFAFFIVSFYNSKYGSTGGATLFMMLYVMPTYITGAIAKFKPMIFGGLVCWVLSIASIFTPVQTDMLLIAVCGLFAWLIPGIILWFRYQKQQRSHV
jgi:hypothetical protein